MKETTSIKLSRWVFWQPLKFSALLFLTVSILTFLYSGFFALRGTSAPMIPFAILLIFVLIYCIARLIKKLPSSEMDRTSFIAIHNAQKTVYFFCILLSSIFFIRKRNSTDRYLVCTLRGTDSEECLSRHFVPTASISSERFVSLSSSDFCALSVLVHSL